MRQRCTTRLTSSQARFQEKHQVCTTCRVSFPLDLLSINYSDSLALPERRYTTMSVTYQGQEVLELVTDSEGEY
jgi:hypothetical protein